MAWVQLDFREKDALGNYALLDILRQLWLQFRRKLLTLPIVEMRNDVDKKHLIESLKKVIARK